MNWISVLAILATVVLSVNSQQRPGCFSGRLDLVLVVDVSGSLENRFIANRDGALEVARAVTIEWEKAANIALIQFSKTAVMKLEFHSSETFESVNDTIMNLEWTGDVSRTAEAMDLAMIMFRRSRPDAQRAIILFSDGNSFNTWQEVVDTSERLKYSEAKIFAVSLGGNTYETELKQYVEFSNGSIIRRQSEFDALKRELQEMTVPRCPPPAAAPPQDFQRPTETNPEDNPENQLPTRRSPPPRRNRPARRTTITTTASPLPTPPVANPPPPLPGGAAPPPNGNPPPPPPAGAAPPPGASVIDATLDKKHRE